MCLQKYNILGLNSKKYPVAISNQVDHSGKKTNKKFGKSFHMYTFVHSYNKHILNTYSVPVAVLGPGDTVVTKRDTAPVLMTIMSYMYTIQYSNH